MVEFYLQVGSAYISFLYVCPVYLHWIKICLFAFTGLCQTLDGVGTKAFIFLCSRNKETGFRPSAREEWSSIFVITRTSGVHGTMLSLHFGRGTPILTGISCSHFIFYNSVWEDIHVYLGSLLKNKKKNRKRRK